MKLTFVGDTRRTVFGYAEDALTFWALDKCMSEILGKLGDPSNSSDCVAFYRPSFGRGGRRDGDGNIATFGEPDSVLASLEDIYLVESKWDNRKKDRTDKIRPGKGFLTKVRDHEIFSWYYMNWDSGSYGDWREFSSDISRKSDFAARFSDRSKKIAPPDSRLAQNLEDILNALQEHCGQSLGERKQPRDVLLYFYDGNVSTEKRSVMEGQSFEIVNIDYSSLCISGNFIRLV